MSTRYEGSEDLTPEEKARQVLLQRDELAKASEAEAEAKGKTRAPWRPWLRTDRPS